MFALKGYTNKVNRLSRSQRAQCEHSCGGREAVCVSVVQVDCH